MLKNGEGYGIDQKCKTRKPTLEKDDFKNKVKRKENENEVCKATG